MKLPVGARCIELTRLIGKALTARRPFGFVRRAAYTALRSDLSLFGDFQCVVDLNAEVAHG